MKRNSKHGAMEQIPWKLPDIVDEIQPSIDDMIFNYLKKHGVIAGVFLENEIAPSTVQTHLVKLYRAGKIKDLGYKRMKLKGRTMFHSIHLYGVNDGHT